MAKHKGPRSEQRRGRPRTNASKVQKPQQKPKAKSFKGPKVQRLNQQQRQQHGLNPFGKHDRILLIGEGDFSFARSLVEHHGCRYVTATCFDSTQELRNKYPQAEDIVSELKTREQRVLCGVDATKLTQREIRRPPLPPAPTDPGDAADASSEEGSEADDNNNDDEADENDDADDASSSGFSNRGPRIQHASHGAGPRPPGARPRGWDIIAFNFPHVGGKSTDVNRQVRHNQSLLVSFFKAALPLLSPPAAPHPAGGAILVTLFESEPYTLWNVKDLGRHAGLRSERSWRFDWSAHPGYKHARTLGNIEGGGGWKGEERAARTYAFVRKDAPSDVPLFAIDKTARERKEHESEDDDDD